MLSFDEDNSQSAVIQIASTEGDTRRSLSCEFHGMQGKRLVLVSAESINVSTPISVNYNDAMFLGEVVACSAESPFRWQLEVKVEQILTGLQSLLALRSNLLGEAVAKPLTMMPIGARN